MNSFTASTIRRVTAAILVSCVISSPAWGISLAPTIIGGAIDVAPFDGLANSIDSTFSGRLLGNINGTQQRVILEFDLSSVPAGSTITAADVLGIIRPNNSFDSGIRNDDFFAYAGDGQLDLSDYNAPGTFIGSTSHLSGGTSSFDFHFSSALNNIFQGGASYVGIRIQPDGIHGWDAISEPPFDPLQLNITYTVPEPASGILLLLAFCCAATALRRTRKARGT